MFSYTLSSYLYANLTVIIWYFYMQIYNAISILYFYTISHVIFLTKRISLTKKHLGLFLYRQFSKWETSCLRLPVVIYEHKDLKKAKNLNETETWRGNSTIFFFSLEASSHFCAVKRQHAREIPSSVTGLAQPRTQPWHPVTHTYIYQQMNYANETKRHWAWSRMIHLRKHACMGNLFCTCMWIGPCYSCRNAKPR